MRKPLLLLAWAILLLVACKKPDDPNPNGGTPSPSHHDPTYQVGDYYHNDTLEGIVFYTIAGGLSGLMVSLNEAKLPWCIPNSINNETGATNPYDGWNNTNILMDNYDLQQYPTIEWSYLKNTWHLLHYDHRHITSRQWYVPSSTELGYLLLNQKSVNITLESMGYPTLEDKTYWSSTETGTRGAASVRLQNEEIVIGETLKDQEFYVRAIRNF